MEILPEDEFDELVVQAIDGLPPEMGRFFRNVAVVVEDQNPDDPRLLGLYHGVPLTRRSAYWGVLPDRISIYRVPLCVVARDLEDLVREIQVTVVHEFGHHMGMPEERLHELGWG